MKKYLLITSIILAGATAKAQSTNTSEISFKVEGICDMCEARIEKAALYTKGVKKADWDPASGKLTVIFRNDKTNREQIEKAVAAIGHDTEAVKAPDEAYNKLHDCCKYRSQEKH